MRVRLPPGVRKDNERFFNETASRKTSNGSGRTALSGVGRQRMTGYTKQKHLHLYHHLQSGNDEQEYHRQDGA